AFFWQENSNRRREPIIKNLFIKTTSRLRGTGGEGRAHLLLPSPILTVTVGTGIKPVHALLLGL
ncbi:MAG: hypothetical protein PF447_11905, partial [Spirochaetaceae bacterium]|nr:hypothetical protein [Spirochaetaceae bacterium]